MDTFGDLDPLPSTSSEYTKSYPQWQERLFEAWSEIRVQLRIAVIESSIPIFEHCNICDKKAAVVCKQCGPQAVFCEDCIETAHLTCNVFHLPQSLKVWKKKYS